MIRDWVPGVRSDAHAAVPGRYHLYAAPSCPWSHRSIVTRALRRLEDAISLAPLHPFRDERGWAMPGDSFEDAVNGFEFLEQAYRATDPSYSGRISSPVLWDRETQRIVNNESADIIRLFNDEFRDLGDPDVDLRPPELLDDIEALNQQIQVGLNSAVYDAGWASSQAAYDAAYERAFATMRDLDARLTDQPFVCGDRLTETDVRLFTTLVRFDAVYYLLYRCNFGRLADFPALEAHTRRMAEAPGVAATIDVEQIKVHYYRTQLNLNPSGIVPRGPEVVAFAPW